MCQASEVKKCSRCGLEKPLTEFIQRSNVKSGYGAMCKPCKNDAQVAQRASSMERERLQAIEDAKALNAEDLVARGVCLPRTFVFTETYVPDNRVYYRNDGNKHIQSRGV